MPEIVYILCCLLSAACAFFLMRGHFRNPSHLLFFSGVCFSLLALNNAILVVDLVLLPDMEFQGPMIRSTLSAGAGSVLLFGLIWELT